MSPADLVLKLNITDGPHQIVPLAKLSNDLRHQLTAVLNKLNERKTKGCANVKAVIQQLSEAENDCENTEIEIEQFCKNLVSDKNEKTAKLWHPST